jgi:GNAT superfamily N-acetyltransferase
MSVPPASLSVRAAEPGDAEALAQLMCELGYETRTSEMQIRFEAIAADSRFATFVAVCGGTVCGMVGTFSHYSYEHNSPSGRILALVVSEGMRGQGIARALVTAAENDFARKNIRRIALNTQFKREGAHQFYERVGYERNGFRFVKTLATAAD